MANPAEEKRIFSAFLADRPLFARSPVANWTQPKQDPLDIDCTLENGSTVGLELTNWLNQALIADAKAQESIEEPFRRTLLAIPNLTHHVKLVWLTVKSRLREADESALKGEMTDLMEYLDKR